MKQSNFTKTIETSVSLAQQWDLPLSRGEIEALLVDFALFVASCTRGCHQLQQNVNGSKVSAPSQFL